MGDTNFIWTFAHVSWVEDVRFHFAQKHPAYAPIASGTTFYQVFFDTIKSLGLHNRTIGFETGAEIASYLSIDEFHMIKEKLPDATIKSAAPVIWAQRTIKTPLSRKY